MRILNCYNCRSNKYTFYAKENGFSLVKCHECGLLYLEDRPEDKTISQSHKQGKHDGIKELDVNAIGKFNSDKIQEYLKVLEDIFQGRINNIKKLLDIGCGYGEFMIALQKYSHGRIALSGTEPNIHKRESACRKGLNVSFFDIECHEEKYDAISLLNVYSHLPDPPAFINSLKRCLNSGGFLIIQTGDTAEFHAKDHYRPFYLPDHLSFASERIVSDILERLDFEIVSVNKYPLVRLNPKQIAKEIVKLALPGHRSKIKYFGRRYSQTNMYILARLKR